MTKKKTIDTCGFCGKTYPHERAHERYCSLDCATKVRLSEHPDENGCIIWLGARNKNGYGQITRNRSRYYVHRVRYELKYGPIPSGLQACHTCDVRSCCNPDHIFIGTASDNMADMMQKGRSRKGKRSLSNFGEGHSQAKLTRIQALEIVSKYRAGGISQQRLADMYNVSQPTVWHVLNNRHWTTSS